MAIEIKSPEWVEEGTVTLRYVELRPSTIVEIIECLTARNSVDVRIFALRNLYESITGMPLG